MIPSSKRLIQLIALGVVLQVLLAELIPVLPWLALGLAGAGVSLVTVRIFVTRSKHF